MEATRNKARLTQTLDVSKLNLPANGMLKLDVRIAEDAFTVRDFSDARSNPPEDSRDTILIFG